MLLINSPGFAQPVPQLAARALVNHGKDPLHIVAVILAAVAGQLDDLETKLITGSEESTVEGSVGQGQAGVYRREGVLLQPRPTPGQAGDALRVAIEPQTAALHRHNLLAID